MRMTLDSSNVEDSAFCNHVLVHVIMGLLLPWGVSSQKCKTTLKVFKQWRAKSRKQLRTTKLIGVLPYPCCPPALSRVLCTLALFLCLSTSIYLRWPIRTDCTACANHTPQTHNQPTSEAAQRIDSDSAKRLLGCPLPLSMDSRSAMQTWVASCMFRWSSTFAIVSEPSCPFPFIERAKCK